MYLDVNWKNGEVTHIPLATSHTLQIVADGKIQDAFSFDGVAGLTLNLDGAPAATNPSPPANEGAAEGATVTAEEQAAADAAAEAARQDAANAEAAASADQAAATTVAAAQEAVAAPDVAPADKQVQVQAALADVEQALAQWPDSQALLDAKAQLEALAGEITAA